MTDLLWQGQSLPQNSKQLNSTYVKIGVVSTVNSTFSNNQWDYHTVHITNNITIDYGKAKSAYHKFQWKCMEMPDTNKQQQNTR